VFDIVTGNGREKDKKVIGSITNFSKLVNWVFINKTSCIHLNKYSLFKEVLLLALS
jgi:hypothetical protein